MIGDSPMVGGVLHVLTTSDAAPAGRRRAPGATPDPRRDPVTAPDPRCTRCRCRRIAWSAVPSMPTTTT